MTKSKPAAHKQVIIAGGGIAGLAAAIALANQGFKIRIFEKAPMLKEQGAGIQLGPNATAILRHWGIEEALLAQAYQPELIELYDGIKGRCLTKLPVEQFAKEHWLAPYVTIHRSDLQTLLRQAAEKKPCVSLQCGAAVHNVTGSLETGFDIEVMSQTGLDKHHADLLLACDGVWSDLRGRDKAQFSNFIAWRTTIKRERWRLHAPAFACRQNVQAFMGPNGHLIAYPIKDGETCNLVAITSSKTPDHHDRTDLVQTFKNWRRPIANIVTNVTDWTYWPLFFVAEPCFLNLAGTVFIGDSAHALTPFAAQGAAMALEDAATLAKFLPDTTSISRQNLDSFAAERSSRVKKVAQRGAFNQFAYHAGGVVAVARNLYMRSRSPEKFLTDLDWLYKHRI